jgi:ABC-type transporter MlaC component
MNRRSLLKNLGLGAAATVALPAWAVSWTEKSLPASPPLKKADEAMLRQIIHVIIPKTDTPGALELGVENFVKAMINTMHTEEEKKFFYNQLAGFDTYVEKKYQYNFDELSPKGRAECLKELADAEGTEVQKFFNIIKTYTIQGYTGSEWYMTEKAGYQYAPGYGHGCVDA